MPFQDLVFISSLSIEHVDIILWKYSFHMGLILHQQNQGHELILMLWETENKTIILVVCSSFHVEIESISLSLESGLRHVIFLAKEP